MPTTASPDDHGAGLTAFRLDALRYDGHTDDPAEVAGMLRALIPAGVKVLDVGCGTGSVTLIANAGKGNDVHAIEPDPDRAAAATARGVRVHRGFLDQAYIDANGPFDVVMSSDVLEHMAAPSEVLRLFLRALRPDGLVLASVPNVAHWSVRANLLLGRFDYEPVGIMDATHLRWFTARSIARLFDEAGLALVSMRHTAGTTLPPYGRGLLRRIPGRLKRPVIRRLARLLPRLFGVQHVVEARRPG